MRQIKYIIPLLLISVFQVFSQVFYIPTAQQVPLLKLGGDYQISGNIGCCTATLFEGQIAFALNNKFAITGAYSSASTEFADAFLVDLGGGYYKNINDEFGYEVFISAAYGSGTYAESKRDEINALDANGLRFAIRPAIGFEFEHHHFAISSRLSYLNYLGIDDNLTEDNELRGYLDSNPEHFVFEPAFTYRLGSKTVFGQLQIVRPILIVPNDLPIDGLAIYLGIVIDRNFKNRKE